MKFIQTNFDKLLLFIIFVMIFSGYIYFRFDALERMLDAIIIAIFTIVGVRRLSDTATTNVEKVENIEMNAAQDGSLPVFHEVKKDEV